MSTPSEDRFRQAVEAAAADHGRIAKVVVNGFSVVLTVVSQSKKQRREGSFSLDPETLNFQYTNDYPGSSQTWGFARDVIRRLKE